MAYSPCAISLVLEGAIENFDSIIMMSPDYYHEQGIDLRTESKIVKIDTEENFVLDEGGKRYCPNLYIIRIH